MPRKPLQDKRKLQLIQATMDSIAKRGLTETTITHISKGAGLSRGIINFYFDSKEMLMRGVLAHLLEEYHQLWTAALIKAEPGKKPQLEAAIRAQFDRRVCSSKRLNVLSSFWGHAASHAPYREQIEASDTAIEAAFAQGMDAAKSRQLYALIRGLWLRYMLAPKQTDREALAAEALDFAGISGKAALKMVADNPKPAKKSPKKAVAPTTTQMDIEDLFANG